MVFVARAKQEYRLTENRLWVRQQTAVSSATYQRNVHATEKRQMNEMDEIAGRWAICIPGPCALDPYRGSRSIGPLWNFPMKSPPRPGSGS